MGRSLYLHMADDAGKTTYKMCVFTRRLKLALNNGEYETNG